MQLHDYQTAYLANMPKNVIMSAAVGLGKSIMALEHARRYGITLPPGKRLIVVAPASKVRTGDWQREIQRFFIDLMSKGEAYMPDYEVISYERFTKDVERYLDPTLTVIFDECHFACNATTKRGKATIKVTKVCKQWIGLSATALPNGWRSAETYAVMTGLVRNKTDFVNRFVIIDRSRGFPLVLGYREQPTLEKWWASISKPLERTGAQHLPSQSIATEIPMRPGTVKEYQRAIKERLYGDEMLDNPSKLFVTLRQIPNAARIDALQSILESTDEHIVVFYNFNSEREAMLEMLNKSFKERTIYEQSGHRSELPARDTWGSLSSSVTLVQYQSGSQAIELTYASVTVYLSPCTSYANYEQSKGRTRRNGQAKTTLFYHIAAENSLDKHIWNILSKKRDFSVDLMQKLLA
jgi:superfamily II DNA or RNA helicase